MEARRFHAKDGLGGSSGPTFPSVRPDIDERMIIGTIGRVS